MTWCKILYLHLNGKKFLGGVAKNMILNEFFIGAINISSTKIYRVAPIEDKEKHCT
jgi:hypothetical protein